MFSRCVRILLPVVMPSRTFLFAPGVPSSCRPARRLPLPDKGGVMFRMRGLLPVSAACLAVLLLLWCPSGVCQYEEGPPCGIGYLSGIARIGAGHSHSMGLKTDETVWAWGRNAEAELGDGTLTDRTAAVQVNGLGGVGYLTGVIGIAGGQYHSLAIVPQRGSISVPGAFRRPTAQRGCYSGIPRQRT